MAVAGPELVYTTYPLRSARPEAFFNSLLVTPSQLLLASLLARLFLSLPAFTDLPPDFPDFTPDFPALTPDFPDLLVVEIPSLSLLDDEVTKGERHVGCTGLRVGFLVGVSTGSISNNEGRSEYVGDWVGV